MKRRTESEKRDFETDRFSVFAPPGFVVSSAERFAARSRLAANPGLFAIWLLENRRSLVRGFIAGDSNRLAAAIVYF